MSEPIIIANGSHEIRIYRTQSKGRPLFQACYYRGGKRERKSFTDLPTAKRECRLILGQLAVSRQADEAADGVARAPDPLGHDGPCRLIESRGQPGWSSGTALGLLVFPACA